MDRSFVLSQGELQIPCRLSQPEDGQIQRIVLGVHGFTGSSLDEIQAGIAEEMELFSTATLRFDFPAHGENPEDTLTLAGCVDTLVAVAGYAREAFPQVEDLCIFATGFGAYVTLTALQDLLEMPGQVKLVIQTPSVRMDQTLLAMRGISRETFWAMDRFTIPVSRPLEITYRFYEELHENVAMNTYPIPMLILHGEQDDYVRMDDILQFRRINEQSKLVIIPGASHRFLEEGAWDMVLDLTRDWFEFEQVLLTDWE